MFRYAVVWVVLWWLAWALFHFYTVSSFGFPWNDSVIDSAISNALLSVLCTGTGFAIRYYRPDPSKAIYIIGAIIVLSWLYVWLDTEMLNEFIAEGDSYRKFLETSYITRFIIAFFMISLSVTVGWIIHYNKEYHEEKSRLLETGRHVKNAELTNLVQKIQPHFLFNTLNSVNALIQTNPEAARKMIQELSGFLRGSLSSNDDKNVVLSDEINQLRLYLEIEKVRFGDRLITSIEIDQQAATMQLPPLLLQPLVENAIKFGLYDTLGQVTIGISAQFESPYLLIRVSNPFDEETSERQPGTGFGLSSLKRRLELHFNRNDLLDVKGQNGIFTATLKIPQT